MTPHYLYDVLGTTFEERSYRYRELFNVNLDENDIHVIRNAAHYCQPTGDDYFKESIERQIGHKLGYAKRGRPSKSG